MTKTSVTYNAPVDDSPVVIMCGVRFFDGQAVELDETEHEELLSKLATNQHFTVDADKLAFESPAPIQQSSPNPQGGSWNS